MRKFQYIYVLIVVVLITSCKQISTKSAEINEKTEVSIKDQIIHETENLVITRLSNHIYTHISYLDTDDFGKVACNGMLVINESKAVVFDTPTTNQGSLELLNFVSKNMASKIIAVIPTHFHSDCFGGIEEFEKQNIQSYAHKLTIEMLKSRQQDFPQSIHEFDEDFVLSLGDKKVYAEYYGEGHTKDNIIGYFPEDNALFGGCLLKSVGASKGYLGDANLEQWPKTVENVKSKYPKIEIVIPGHGKWGGTDLLDYTMELFENH